MKNYISILVLLILVSSVSAQEERGTKRDEKRKQKSERRASRMEAKKVAYITDELDLSTEEAQRFWPIYNDFQGEMKSLRETSREDGSSDIDFTDEEAESFLNTIFDQEQKKLNLKKKYYNEMQSAISKVKVAKLYSIERKFREKVYNSIKRKMKERGKSKS